MVKTMKIQLASDLHLEFLKQKWPSERLVAPAAGADVLVLAGDIHNGTDAFKLFAEWASSTGATVIYVAGNHEFYGHEIESTRETMREAAALCGIHFLENERVEIGGVRFLAATLWTDYLINQSLSQQQSMLHAQHGLNDHLLIRTERRTFTAQDALDRHEASRAWLATELAQPFEGKTVVVTHHGPHPKSVHAKYAHSDVNAAFVSDLSELMPGADLWLHGHCHDSFDYQVGRCRVVANPAGYLTNRGWKTERDDFEFENKGFDPQLLLELGI